MECLNGVCGIEHATTTGDPVSGLVLLGFLLGVYFLPAIIALARHHHQRIAILVLNLVAGWTLIGWVVALVWASTAVKKESVS
jgi:Superinfection immunity protein